MLVHSNPLSADFSNARTFSGLTGMLCLVFRCGFKTDELNGDDKIEDILMTMTCMITQVLSNHLTLWTHTKATRNFTPYDNLVHLH